MCGHLSIRTMQHKAKECENCGQVFMAKTGRRGRPEVYCSKSCSKMVQIQNWMYNLILDPDYNPTPEKAMRLRQLLWEMGNQLTHFTKKEEVP